MSAPGLPAPLSTPTDHPEPPGPAALAPSAASLLERGPSFDLAALLDLLRAWYPERPIRYACYPSRSPRGRLVERVELFDDHVLITLNMGLTAPNSPLTSYFFELMADPTRGEVLRALIGALDADLLKRRAAVFRPETDPWLLGDVNAVRAQLLTVLRPDSPWLLYRVFASVFPEMSVEVVAGALDEGLPASAMRMGSGLLGEAALGGHTISSAEGFAVTLRTRVEMTWSHEPWSHIARHRLTHDVLPLLAGTRMFLQVVLVDITAEQTMALGPSHNLGYEAMGGTHRPEVQVLYQQKVPERGG